MTDKNRATARLRPVGRSLRMIAGLWLLLESVRGLWVTSPGARLLAAVVLVGALVFYGAVQLLTSRVGRTHPWLGAILAVVPLALVFVLGGPGGQLGVILFLGSSLLVSAVRADRGCEVTAISGAILGRRTHLVCLVFSPVDWMEERLAQRRQANAVSSS